jgi:hypothetical protein
MDNRKSFESNTETPEDDNLEQRLAGAKGNRLHIVLENPGPGQLTPDELGSFDPQQGMGDYASAAAVTAMIYDGQFTPEDFVSRLAADKPRNLDRCQATFDRMVQGGLLQVRDDRVYMNVDLH